jgi:hypothetical protein
MGISIAEINVGDFFKGLGSLALSIRSAITGSMTPEQKSQVLVQLSQLEAQAEKAEIAYREAQAKVIIAEAQGESWLQRNWRPILMLTIVFIVANNYVIAPYISLFGYKSLALELPETMWNLMNIGVGGYVVGRSGEKIATAVAEVMKK